MHIAGAVTRVAFLIVFKPVQFFLTLFWEQRADPAAVLPTVLNNCKLSRT